MNYWPSILPLPSQSYSAAVTGRLAINTFEVGFRQRQRYTSNEDSLQVSWLMSQLQFDIFRAFVKHALNSGADAFVTSIIGLSGIEEAEVYLKDGAFTAAYTPHAMQTVTATLIRVNPTVIDAETFGILCLPEAADLPAFESALDALWTYIEFVYGESASNELTDSFMQLYN